MTAVGRKQTLKFPGIAYIERPLLEKAVIALLNP